jgi:hypothetical protein
LFAVRALLFCRYPTYSTIMRSSQFDERTARNACCMSYRISAGLDAVRHQLAAQR